MQRELILAMAEQEGRPAGSLLRQVAELENVIAAVEAVAHEEGESVPEHVPPGGAVTGRKAKRLLPGRPTTASAVRTRVGRYLRLGWAFGG